MKSALVALIWLAIPAIALLLVFDGEIDGRIRVEPVTAPVGALDADTMRADAADSS